VIIPVRNTYPTAIRTVLVVRAIVVDRHGRVGHYVTTCLISSIKRRWRDLENAKTTYDFGYLGVGGRHQRPRRSCGRRYLYGHQHIRVGYLDEPCFRARRIVHLRVYRPLAMLVIFHPSVF